MACKILLTEFAERDMQSICDYFSVNQQENRIESFHVQMENVFRRIALDPEVGSWPEELLKMGILDYREIYSHPYRVFYQYENNAAEILLIVDAHRDLEMLLETRILMS